MAALRKDWEDFNITRDEANSLFNALKNEEFRKLLVDYVEEIQHPDYRKKYQEEIVQLEAERGIDCTFVNPSPGFVVKTSLNGVQKAFINICSNELIDKPTCKAETRDNTRGLFWEIPHSMSPGREDMDKKNNRCMVYDVVFHPDTLHLSQNSPQYHKLVIDTSLNSIEEANKVSLDKSNYKLPKLQYKGQPQACVIRKKSTKPVVLSDEEKKFHDNLNLPPVPELIAQPKVAQSNNSKQADKYIIPHYSIKYRNDVDMGEYTDDRFSKINAAIPKELIVDIHLPLLHSTKTVNLDVAEKSLQLQCDKPAMYKLNILLPYTVSETGNATFDTTSKILTVTLPVLRKSIKVTDFIREDSGVESDLGEDHLVQETMNLPQQNVSKILEEFLNPDVDYLLPNFDMNRENNTICFILKTKNIDPASVKKQKSKENSFHIKMTSLGSGLFPINYSFCAIFNVSIVKEPQVEVYDNNVTIQAELSSLNREDTLQVGVSPDKLSERHIDEIIDLTNMLENLETEPDEVMNNVAVLSANLEEVVFEVDMRETVEESAGEAVDSPEESIEPLAKLRTMSEGSNDEMVGARRKSILKKRMNRSLSESCADENTVQFPCGVLYTWSDSCIPEQDQEDEEIKEKKKVRFSQHIQRMIFRSNSSILGQRRKNQKRTRNKKRAQERRASESENSEGEERDKFTKKQGNADNNNPTNKNNNSAHSNPSQITAKSTGKPGKKNKNNKNLNFQSQLATRLD